MYDFLKKVPFFADLNEADLDRLCEMVEEVDLPAGRLLFAEGSAGEHAYVIKEGELEIFQTSGGRELLLAVRHSGEVIGEMALVEEAPRMASVRARTDTTLLAIGQEQLEHLLDTSPSAARSIMQTIVARWRSTESLTRQSEKMAQLGTLTAGVAHELNNPAAAVQRGAEQLAAAVAQWQQAHMRLNELNLSREQLDSLMEIDRIVQEQSKQPMDMDPITRSDCESELEMWLEDRGVDNAWELAPALVNIGCDGQQLGVMVQKLTNEQLPAVFAWLTGMVNIYSLVAEMAQGAGRIAEIVKSLKSYAYLDQAPVQPVNVHEGIDNTLVMLRSKLKSGVNVRREYAPNIPRIQGYGSELNQVWTNLIDNAVDAMDGKGQIVVRTRQEDQWIVVEIEDNGPGIPEAIQSKIFDPFFTTKPPGKGTGLGLNITYNVIVHKHRGQINVYSKPGWTLFQVRLPINFEAADSGSAVPLFTRAGENKLRRILQTAKNVAVVGISSRPDRSAHTVPAYLKEHGYRIFPVNPGLDQVLGEKAYPDLLSIPEPIDVVLIFRRSEYVPPIVDEAIEIGAKVFWMQETIVNESAAITAQMAGLEVVMDECMRAAHKRLIT